ncbi:SCO family protein [Lutimonas halocynthiae]|uniref:SCO family protein n=1 Tax=Lutimonas halocynthiae TaxID=1446477 RepID=UPI0025B3ADE6|nr:SCO family protein [Lutimonas halocynthiae]MDN3643281.1 SCO family protein [Lutimonas halocynthiae]
MSNLKVCFIILFALVFISSTSCNQASEETLPIYNPSDFDPVLVDRSLRDTNKNHKVSDFSLINQSGDIITQKVYENKIYVVDFFFTRCQTICPIMTNNMAKIQKEFMNDSDVMLLSLSVTPDIDSVSVLQKYAMDKGVIASKWNITTGEKKHIYNLARKSYFAVVEQGDGDLQDFIHTSNFVLVDKDKQIRGQYDGTDTEELKRIIEDIKVLIN